jgi:hypothetical protein
MQVGNKVKFVKQSCSAITRVPIGGVGILCDITTEDELNYYVVFNQLSYSDWFNREELEDMGVVE